jgi:hypothetical protein
MLYDQSINLKGKAGPPQLALDLYSRGVEIETLSKLDKRLYYVSFAL